jgi:hypothetical protein
MFDQLDLFLTSNSDYEEEQKIKEHQRKVALAIEKAKKEREEFLTKNLTSRQHRLVDYLKDNFISGKWFTIEELCNADLGYTLNTNPKVHDKCASLGADIRAINWAIAQRYSIIIKNKQGSCKLAESKEEFDTWKNEEKAKVERKYQYLNNLEYKVDRDGTMPIINLNDRALEDSELEFVEVFKGE